MVFSAAGDRVFFAMNCHCEAHLDFQLWSKEKLGWSQKAVKLSFPSNFAMLTGCAVNIGNDQVLFIGGHHTAYGFEMLINR